MRRFWGSQRMGSGAVSPSTAPNLTWLASWRIRRGGLAPLEFVLIVPLMLMVMALMINFGHLAAWKTRAHWAAREAQWRQRPTHFAGQRDAAPRSWQPPTTMSVERSGPDLFPNDPFEQHSVARGPELRDPNWNDQFAFLAVETGLLDFDGNLKQGRATINREVALLKNLYQISFDVKHPLLEGEWRFHEMGFGSNTSRRSIALYRYWGSQAVHDATAEFQEAGDLVFSSPMRRFWKTLDDDDELKSWYGSAPDFHPQLPETVRCTLDRDAVMQADVLPLIDRIQGPRGGGAGGVPDRVAAAFLSMYRQQLRILQSMNPLPVGEIATLNQKIKEIEDFQGKLR